MSFRYTVLDKLGTSPLDKRQQHAYLWKQFLETHADKLLERKFLWRKCFDFENKKDQLLKNSGRP